VRRKENWIFNSCRRRSGEAETNMQVGGGLSAKKEIPNLREIAVWPSSLSG